MSYVYFMMIEFVANHLVTLILGVKSNTKFPFWLEVAIFYTKKFSLVCFILISCRILVRHEILIFTLDFELFGDHSRSFIGSTHSLLNVLLVLYLLLLHYTHDADTIIYPCQESLGSLSCWICNHPYCQVHQPIS